MGDWIWEANLAWLPRRCLTPRAALPGLHMGLPLWWGCLRAFEIWLSSKSKLEIGLALIGEYHWVLLNLTVHSVRPHRKPQNVFLFHAHYASFSVIWPLHITMLFRDLPSDMPASNPPDGLHSHNKVFSCSFMLLSPQMTLHSKDQLASPGLLVFTLNALSYLTCNTRVSWPS